MRTSLVAVAMIFAAGTALAGDTPAPADAAVYFISPLNGDVLSSPVTVVFGLQGMGVAPAGTEKENTGHHHLLIDAPTPAGNALNEPLPDDDNHVHFGGGQTETSVELAPGSHTLQLVLGDWSHIPHNPPVMSRKITITVK